MGSAPFPTIVPATPRPILEPRRFGGGFPPMRVFAIALAVTTPVALAFTLQMFVSYRYLGDGRRWQDVLVARLVDWWSWALLAPAIAAIVNRAPLGATPLLRNAALQTGAAGLFVGLHAIMIASILPALYWPVAWAPWRDVFLGQLNRGLATSFLVYALIVAICETARQLRKSRDTALDAERHRTAAATARLDALRAQLHPHFLFNALNGATELVESDPANAARLLRSLAELLRQALRRDSGDVRLAEEIALLDLYVGIEHLRFADAFSVSFDVADDVRDLRVPGLILQPIVENAIRHGLRQRSKPLLIGVTAFRSGETLHIEVRDNGPGLSGFVPAGEAPSESPGQGIGLANTAARLRAQYQGRARMEVTDMAGSGCIARIELPASVGAA